MIKPSVLDAMVAAGCTAEQIAAAVKADQAGSSGAARQARYRARKASQSDERNVTPVTVTDDVSPKKESSPTPPKEKTTPSPVSEPIGSSTEHARPSFADFWSMFPNKVGKRKAEVEFAAALHRADFGTIMAGLRRYVAKTDDRPWCNPATFLHQNRWDDQPATVPQQRNTGPPNRGKPTVVDAYEEIARERGWIEDEPEFLPSHNGHDQRFSAERGEPQGAVIDLRTGAFRRIRSIDR